MNCVEEKQYPSEKKKKANMFMNLSVSKIEDRSVCGKSVTDQDKPSRREKAKT